MSETKSDPPGAEDAETPESAAEPAKPEVADVQISDSGAEEQAASPTAGVREPVTSVLPPIGRPPLGKIYYGILAFIATAMLWFAAGSLNQQACVATAEGHYPTAAGKAGALNNQLRRTAVDACSQSPF